jgi:chemotaxis protein CheD
VPVPTLIGFEHRVVVGLAEFAVSNNANVILSTYSLGSCLGVAIYDPVAKVGGLLHAMLPDSNLDASKAQAQPAMFVDAGMRCLLRAAGLMRALNGRLKIYVAGGAQVMDDNKFFNIGARNCTALGEFLQRENLRVEAQQVGGHVNRTVHLNIATGQVTLRVSGNPKEVVLC